MHQITIQQAQTPYDVFIERRLLARAETFAFLRGKSAAVVRDDNLRAHPQHETALCAALEASGVNVRLLGMPAGEQRKTLAQLGELCSALSNADIGREDVVIALGGGVTGDMAGLAAAVYLRGVSWVYCPTTLLAQVDASIGGKVAIDMPEGKNLLGAFHPPMRVLIDPDTLATLPTREFSCGMAEVIKHAALFDAALFAQLEAWHGRIPGDALAEIIARNCALKAEIVARDPFDRGERALLNFGHTPGHALEALSHYQLTHGEAIAAGMVLMARWGEARGVTAPGCAERIARLCAVYGLDATAPLQTYASDWDGGAARLLPYLLRDKKRVRATVRWVFLRDIGDAFIDALPAQALIDWMKAGGLNP